MSKIKLIAAKIAYKYPQDPWYGIFAYMFLQVMANMQVNIPYMDAMGQLQCIIFKSRTRPRQETPLRKVSLGINHQVCAPIIWNYPVARIPVTIWNIPFLGSGILNGLPSFGILGPGWQTQPIIFKFLIHMGNLCFPSPSCYTRACRQQAQCKARTMECPDNLISHQVGGQKIYVFFLFSGCFHGLWLMALFGMFILNKKLEDPNKLINFTYFMVSF